MQNVFKASEFYYVLADIIKRQERPSVQVKLPSPTGNMLLSCRPLEQTPRQSLDAGRIHGHSLPSTQSEQITPIVSFSHLQPQGHT